jgi:hypothetical protein
MSVEFSPGTIVVLKQSNVSDTQVTKTTRRTTNVSQTKSRKKLVGDGYLM